VAISDDHIREAQSTLASGEGIFACLEGAATIGALEVLVEQGWIDAEESVVVFNTGSGLKHRWD
jgi:threonine synthase